MDTGQLRDGGKCKKREMHKYITYKYMYIYMKKIVLTFDGWKQEDDNFLGTIKINSIFVLKIFELKKKIKIK